MNGTMRIPSVPLISLLRVLGIGAVLACAAQIRAVEPPVSFRAQIAPLLLEQCQTCHGPTQQKGGYRLDTFEFLSRNEDPNDPVLLAGKPEKSRLYTLLVEKSAEDRMPQKSDPLPSAQAELVRRWIAEGANFDGGEAVASLVEIVPPRAYPEAPRVYARPLPVTALAFSPDGSELWVSGLRELTVWDPVEGRLLRRIGNVAPRTFEITFSPDGATVACAGGAPGEYGEARLFDAKSGEMRTQVASSVDALMDVKFSPNGKRLATAGADHTVSVFDIASGKRLHRLAAHSDAVTAVAFSADGTRFASVGLDRGAKVFDSESGKLVGIYRDHQAALYAVAFTPDGTQLLTAGRDKALHLWNLEDGKKKQELSGLGDVFKLMVSESTAYVGGSSGKVSEFGAADLKLGKSLSGGSEWTYAVAMHPKSKRFAAGGYDGVVTVWNLEDGKVLKQFSASPGCELKSVVTSK